LEVDCVLSGRRSLGAAMLENATFQGIFCNFRATTFLPAMPDFIRVFLAISTVVFRLILQTLVVRSSHFQSEQTTVSRKHFIQLAAAIKAISDQGERRRTAELIADVCQTSNPRFNRARFLTACEVVQ
jgi:hypothetical protein